MINIDSILKKTKKFSNSNEGKTKVQKLREQAFDKGETFGTSNNGGITSVNGYGIQASEYLEYLRNYKDTRFSPALVEIIQEIANSSNCDITIQKEGNHEYKVSITFNKNLLGRRSLAYDYNGGYLNNILALFNNGMDVKNGNTPIGWWDTHGIKIKGVTHRDRLAFMQNTTKQFYNKYKKDYNIKSIDIGDIYKE